jgi:hypothetical protein
MSEASEIAQGMLENYLAWLRLSSESNSMGSARKFALGDSILAHESSQIVDNVAWSLYRNAK